jgi:hypothetical protein
MGWQDRNHGFVTKGTKGQFRFLCHGSRMEKGWAPDGVTGKKESH